MIIKILLTFLLSILSGILGRMGGAKGYHTLYRDIGCSILTVGTFCIWYGFKLEYWSLYLLCLLLHYGALTTYCDKIFGYDCFWFSGFLVGLAMLPLGITYKVWWIYSIRTILIGIKWETLNRYLPKQILWWRRDIVEEFLRYFVITVANFKK